MKSYGKDNPTKVNEDTTAFEDYFDNLSRKEEQNNQSVASSAATGHSNNNENEEMPENATIEILIKDNIETTVQYTTASNDSNPTSSPPSVNELLPSNTNGTGHPSPPVEDRGAENRMDVVEHYEENSEMPDLLHPSEPLAPVETPDNFGEVDEMDEETLNNGEPIERLMGVNDMGKEEEYRGIAQNPTNEQPVDQFLQSAPTSVNSNSSQEHRNHRSHPYFRMQQHPLPSTVAHRPMHHSGPTHFLSNQAPHFIHIHYHYVSNTTQMGFNLVQNRQMLQNNTQMMQQSQAQMKQNPQNFDQSHQPNFDYNHRDVNHDPIQYGDNTSNQQMSGNLNQMVSETHRSITQHPRHGDQGPPMQSNLVQELNQNEPHHNSGDQNQSAQNIQGELNRATYFQPDPDAQYDQMLPNSTQMIQQNQGQIKQNPPYYEQLHLQPPNYLQQESCHDATHYGDNTPNQMANGLQLLPHQHDPTNFNHGQAVQPNMRSAANEKQAHSNFDYQNQSSENISHAELSQTGCLGLNENAQMFPANEQIMQQRGIHIGHNPDDLHLQTFNYRHQGTSQDSNHSGNNFPCQQMPTHLHQMNSGTIRQHAQLNPNNFNCGNQGQAMQPNQQHSRTQDQRIGGVPRAPVCQDMQVPVTARGEQYLGSIHDNRNNENGNELSEKLNSLSLSQSVSPKRYSVNSPSIMSRAPIKIKRVRKAKARQQVSCPKRRAKMDGACNHTATYDKKKLNEKEKRKIEFDEKSKRLTSIQDDISRSEKTADFGLDVNEQINTLREDSVRAKYEVRKQAYNKTFAEILKTDQAIIKTETEYKDAKDDYERKSRRYDQVSKTVKKAEEKKKALNTAGSQKSRAKWKMGFVELSCKIAKLEIKIREAEELKLLADNFVRVAATKVAHLVREPPPMVWDWIVRNRKTEEWNGLRMFVAQDVPVNLDIWP